jgi:hypothetical protein
MRTYDRVTHCLTRALPLLFDPDLFSPVRLLFIAPAFFFFLLTSKSTSRIVLSSLSSLALFSHRLARSFLFLPLS